MFLILLRGFDMVYRLHFEAKGGFWVVQFQRHFLWWSSVRRLISGPAGEKPVDEVLTFDTLKDAEDYCAARGIDKAYVRMPTAKFMDRVIAHVPQIEEKKEA